MPRTVRAITKRVHYRDQGGATQAEHAAHWKGFTWATGKMIVSYVGHWGEIQVWGLTHDEARRVILHACAIASIPTSGAGAGEWIETEAKNPRYGKEVTVRVTELWGMPVVTKRNGPSGPAEIGT